ncbi:hypothetical protein X777_05047, partial [Ooceraea biroi]
SLGLGRRRVGTRRPAPTACVRDHAARAGAANHGEGLVGGRPISAPRSARDRVIAGVLFTCSQSDSGRDRDVSARGERGRYVMASRRAPSVMQLAASHPRRPTHPHPLQSASTSAKKSPHEFPFPDLRSVEAFNGEIQIIISLKTTQLS